MYPQGGYTFRVPKIPHTPPPLEILNNIPGLTMNRPNEVNSGGRDLYCCTPLCECIVGSRYEETNIGLDWIGRKTVLLGFLLAAFKFQEKHTQKKRNFWIFTIWTINSLSSAETKCNHRTNAIQCLHFLSIPASFFVSLQNEVVKFGKGVFEENYFFYRFLSYEKLVTSSLCVPSIFHSHDWIRSNTHNKIIMVDKILPFLCCISSLYT